MNDTQERLVTREQASATSQSVTLQHALAGVLREHLNNAPTLSSRSYIPLEVSAAVPESGIKLVGDKFIRGEDAECMRVPVDTS